MTKQQLAESIVQGRRQRRFGKPRTDAERRKRHKQLYGTTKLPTRGTGLQKRVF